MTMNSRWIALLLLAAAACAPKSTASKGADLEDPSGDKSTVEHVDRQGAGPVVPGTPKTQDAKPIGEVPASAKTDGYEYFGLAYNKPLDFELKNTSGTTKTGSQTTSYEGVKDGNASFVINRTGGLVDYGETDHVISTPEGVFTISTSSGKMAAKHLELPAKLGPGVTWKSNIDLTTVDGQRTQSEDRSKVVGTEQVKTQGGTFDALLVTAEGDATIGGQKGKTQSKTWYVKGRGAVKYELTITPAGKAPVTVTLEETKPGGK